MGQRITYWIFLGIIGLSTFFLLQPAIDFNAGAPIEESRATVESKMSELSSRLGFSADSLYMLTTRTQHINYYRALKDSLGERLPSPYVLNRRGLNLTGWKVTVGSRLNDQDFMVVSIDDLFQKVGRLQVRYDNSGRVRNIRYNSEYPNPTFVAGDSLFSIAGYITGSILNYNLDEYILDFVDVQDTVMVYRENDPGAGSLDWSDSAVGNNTTFHWVKKNSDGQGPQELILELKPVIKEVVDDGTTGIKYGASVERFEALDAYEPESPDGSLIFSNFTFIVSFVALGVLICVVFYFGIKHINKGQVEWRRAMFIFGSVALGVIGWRAIYLINTLDPFLNKSANSVFLLNQVLMGGACGLYAALAYIGWEAVARSDGQRQVHLIDAYWRKRFFFHETGDSLIKGYALGGVLLGLFAFVLYMLDGIFYQADSQFGFAEPSLQPKVLTINMSAWINVWLVALGHVGVVLGVLQQKLRNSWWYYPSGVLLMGFLFGGSATLIAVNGPIWYDLLVFGLMAPAIIYAFSESGLLTFSTGWWLFVMMLLILPYWGSPNIDVAYIAWVQICVMILPLGYGFIAYRYGASVSELGGYIPEYQERMANHLRVEKEIEIARESQFKLMPLQPPSINGVDLYGFFMPSFEVGGDYFDYVVNRNGSAEPEAVTMTIVDVSGKAMKAAMHAVFTSGLLLSRLHSDHPHEILREVAPTLYARTDPQTFITCIIAKYHLQSSILTIANAGHCLPILKRAGRAEFVKTPAPKYPLGIRTEVPYESLELALQPGDFILMYSDGLPEAVDPEGQRFGFDTLLELVTTLDTNTKSSNEIALEIKRKVQKFSDYQLADDTTIICLKV
jgi:hypothetical protein